MTKNKQSGRSTGSTSPTVTNQRGTFRGARPVMTPTKANGMVVRNSEIVLEFTGNGAARDFEFGLSPVDANCFAWLHSIARNYGHYRWRKLRLVYQSQVSTAVSGDISLGIAYDIQQITKFAALGEPQQRQAISASRDAFGGPVWGSSLKTVKDRLSGDMMVDIDVELAHQRFKWLMCNSYTATTEDADDNLAVGVYIMGQLGGNGSWSALVGTLWVDYEIEFMHPVSPLLQTGTPTFMSTKKWPPINPHPKPPPKPDDPKPELDSQSTV